MALIDDACAYLDTLADIEVGSASLLARTYDHSVHQVSRRASMLCRVGMAERVPGRGWRITNFGRTGAAARARWRSIEASGISGR